jgi:hypothetical protein
MSEEKKIIITILYINICVYGAMAHERFKTERKEYL